MAVGRPKATLVLNSEVRDAHGVLRHRIISR
jgi:hypothetical protein